MLMSADRPAKLHYMANGFRILANGDHVVCAVTGDKISLESLRYWSIQRQEPYATPEAATKAALGQ
jgi:hypothetical protein